MVIGTDLCVYVNVCVCVCVCVYVCVYVCAGVGMAVICTSPTPGYRNEVRQTYLLLCVYCLI
jgi:hypothetical protein